MTMARAAMMLAVIFLLGAHRAAAQTAAGSLTAVSGTVTITRGTATIPGAYGTAVQVGDRITTGPSSSATITLSDGTQMELTDSATLTIDKELVSSTGTRQSTQVTLLGGLVRSLVRFTPGTAPNYEVHTPNAVAAARGTSYDCQYSKGVTNDKYPGCLEFTNVEVFDGVVGVTNPTNRTSPEVEVKPGQKVIVPCGAGPVMAGAGGGASSSTTTALVVGGVVVGAAGAGVGGAAAAGAFSGGSSNNGPASTPTPTPAPVTGNE
jgi:ferric-dicitrate binding protein FerR (iron transport regulator)